MNVYLISRHSAAVEWLRSQSFSSATHVPHADEGFWAGLKAGDLVIGTLPMHLAAKAVEVTGRPVGFLSLFVPEDERGKELSVADMERLGASIRWYHVAEAEAPAGEKGGA